MSIHKFVTVLVLVLAALPAAAQQPVSGTEMELGTSTEPLAILGDVVLTQGEIDGAFNKVAPEHRLPFIRSGERVDLVIQNLIKNKALAAEARKAGFDQTPVVQQRMALAAEKELADAWLQKVVDDAPEADYEALARETYLSDPEPWKTPETVDVSHLLVSSETRTEQEARAKAEELRAEIIADPSLFEDLVMEFSDDPSKTTNQGRFSAVSRGQMVAPFEEMAFSMQEEGEISPLVQTTYGYHIIRLNGHSEAGVRPFGQVKQKLMADERKKHETEVRANYLRRFSATPIELPDGAVEALAKRYFGEDLELAPQFDQ